jgi:GGDEF domain-containing protein
MLNLAISVGAAVFPHDGESYETLLATADSRMYRDKTRRKRHAPGTAGDEGRSPVAETHLKRSAGGLF